MIVDKVCSRVGLEDTHYNLTFDSGSMQKILRGETITNYSMLVFYKQHKEIKSYPIKAAIMIVQNHAFSSSKHIIALSEDDL